MGEVDARRADGEGLGARRIKKYAGGIFSAKVGSKLCLRPWPKVVVNRVRDAPLSAKSEKNIDRAAIVCYN